MFWSNPTSTKDDNATQHEARNLRTALTLAESEADNGKKLLLFDDLGTRAKTIENNLARQRNDEQAGNAMLLVVGIVITGLGTLVLGGEAATALGTSAPGLWGLAAGAVTMFGTGAIGQKIIKAMTDRFDKKNGDLLKTAKTVSAAADIGRRQVEAKGLPALAESAVLGDVLKRFPAVKEDFVTAAISHATPEQLKALVTPKPRPAHPANFTGVAA